MIILGIESSCDDTSVALIEAFTPTAAPLSPPRAGGEHHFRILSEITASQIDIHKKYGGVVPEIAGRKHAEKIVPFIEETLKNIVPDVIAVTAGPGLITGLVVGVETARTLSYVSNVLVVAVNHIDGHVHSVEAQNPKSEVRSQIEFPALCLIVSGGHTELLLSSEHNMYSLIGKTRDDAAGECFDKVGKLLGFEYPGGPKISKCAETGNPKAIDFPRPMLDSGNYDFSFAGLKTAALYWLRDNELKSQEDFCASFEQAIVDVLVGKTMRAVEQYQPKTVVLAGGVAANKKLRETLQSKLTNYPPASIAEAFRAGNSTTFIIPTIQYCMDNGAMIAIAGYYKAIRNEFTPWQKLNADPNWHVYDNI